MSNIQYLIAKAMFLITLLNFISLSSYTQSIWQKVNIQNNNKIDFCNFGLNNSLILGIQNNAAIVQSKKDLSSIINRYQIPNFEFNPRIGHKEILYLEDSIYLLTCNSGACAMASLNGQSFIKKNIPDILISKGSELVKILDKYYIIKMNYIYPTDSNFQFNFSNYIYKSKTPILNFAISGKFIYLATVDYDINPLSKYFLKVIKFDVNTFSEETIFLKEISSIIPANNIFINNFGEISVLINKNYYYTSQTYKDSLININIDPNFPAQSFSHFMTNDVANPILRYPILFTDHINIYINPSKDLKTWIRKEDLSNGLPFFPTQISINENDDALCIINNGCDQNSGYIYTTTTNEWKKIILNTSIYTFHNLMKDSKGFFYAKNFCTNSNAIYSISMDEGQTWNNFYLNGLGVKEVIINDNGNPIVTTENNELFYFDEVSHSYIPTVSKLIFNNNQKLSYFYKNKGVIFIDVIEENINLSTKNYFSFYSIDQGKSWQKMKSPQKYSAGLIEPLKDYRIDSLGQWLAFGFDVDTTQISKDQGKTWSNDFRFIEFNQIFNIIPISDGRFIIDGRYAKKPNFYIGNINSGFSLLNSSIPYSSRLRLSQNELLYYATTDGIAISSDLGTNFHHFTGGIIPSKETYHYPASVLWTTNETYLSIANDGIYKTNKNIFTKNETPKKDNPIQFFNDEIGFTLLFPSEQTHFNIRIKIFDLTGRCITNIKLKDHFFRYNDTALPKSMYLIGIYSDEKFIKTIKYSNL